MTVASINQDDADSTELARYEPQELSKLARWALDARQASLVAESLARTKFVPKSMQGKPHEVTAAILTGQEIGLEPMSSLRSIDLIEGVPAMRAHALRGLVQSRGHDIWVEDSSDTRAVVCGRRRGTDTVQKVTWDLARAKKMELVNKGNWRKMPQAMLIARATAEVCRLVASDVLLGMPYATEELADDADDATTAEPAKTTRQPTKRTAKRKPLSAIATPELVTPQQETRQQPQEDQQAEQGDNPEPEDPGFEQDGGEIWQTQNP